MNTHDIELPEPKYPGTKLDIPNAIPDLYTAEQVIAAIEADRKRGTAKQRYDSAMEGSMEADPIERLRFYCSLAMSGQDWLDVEPFFDDLIADRQQRGEPVVMGLGKYVINHSATSEPPQLIISHASDSDRTGREIGESRDNQPGKTIDPSDMVVRIFFDNAKGLDALEAQLTFLREAHFPYSAPAPPSGTQDNIIITENGGVQLNVSNPEVANKLFALIDQFRSARPSGSQGDMTALKTAEAFNADIPVTEQEEEEWKRLEDRK